MAQIDLDRIVQLVNERGFAAYVEQTGGGCATIYAGEEFTDDEGDARWPVLAGPGWFEGPGWTLGRADSADFYIGRDDDGVTGPDVTGVPADMTEEWAAELIASLI